MVVGIEKFKEYFKAFPNSYIIIGGTACDVVLADAGLIPRATKDIDMILIVEVLKPEFVKKFWEFIRDGDYRDRQNSEKKKNYYRFRNPSKDVFPVQIELFSRVPDLINADKDIHLIPIPTDEDLSSLSAILLEDDYYNYTISQSRVEDGIHYASPDSLICLKAKAFVDLTERKNNGESIDSRNIKKHKSDIFRLATLYSSEVSIAVPDSLKQDLNNFVDSVKDDLPDKSMFKDLGLPKVNVDELFKQFISNFNLTAGGIYS